MRRSVDGAGDDVSSVGGELYTVDADLFGGQHDVGDGRRPLLLTQLHRAHLERAGRRVIATTAATAARQEPAAVSHTQRHAAAAQMRPTATDAVAGQPTASKH